MGLSPEQIIKAYTHAYLTIAELAEITGLSEAYWRQIVYRRQIAVLKAGRAVRISRRDLDQFLAARRREAR